LEREDFVQDEYPRILYPFSDILCYVVQQWPSNQKTLVTDLILWASRAHDKALNQAILPSCIIVVNDTTMKGRHHDHEITTGAILGGIENYPIQGEEIETLANEWNEIARTRSSRITTLGQLFHRYFRDVQILYIPPRSGGSANIVRTQLHKLRDKLQTTSAAIQRQREDTGGRVNTRQLDVYLSRAFESLWSGSGWPFDFGKYATIQEEAPTDLCQHASNLMSQLREQVMNISPDQFESCVANLLSSCAMFHLIRRFPELSEDGGRFSPRGGTIFIRHAKRILKRDVDEFGAAYRRFHQDSRCWYRRGTKQCRNRAKGHSKDHQEYHGSVFAFGGYHTYWTERGNKRFVKRMREVSSRLISSSFSEPFASVLGQHLDNLQSQKEFLQHIMISETCLLCLGHVADIALSCGHAICRDCLRAVGQPCQHGSTFELPECVICGDKFRRRNAWDRIVLKPETAKPRVLAIDGAGVRSVMSAHILILLQAHLGSRIPISRFFDLIVGNSSGIYLS